MKKKKVNPNRKPATAMAIFLTVLVDKFNGAEYIKEVWAAVNSLSDSISKGYVDLFDLKKVLEEEYNIELS